MPVINMLCKNATLTGKPEAARPERCVVSSRLQDPVKCLLNCLYRYIQQALRLAEASTRYRSRACAAANRWRACL